ncbi:hypothetical protein [Streptosporangium lutulentum]|uniref:Hemophore-related protein n=1 Tax=Streptosporangium lutulentum TaxID=1461250 RepID=A0ABT9QB39_9ACTN|nr:hypothetical protein [Streptosporangium lutulentum]MDP9843975.1 hypothetical protein [Streptosporangium lutulentum]
MYIRTATALVAVGLFSALTTAATASAASASAPAAPAPCAQEHLALMEAEDNLAKVDAVPAVKNAYEAMMKARDAANVDKLSQQMAQHELSANAPALDPAAKKALDAYNAAGAKYMQVLSAELSKVTPRQQNARDTLKKCLKAKSS